MGPHIVQVGVDVGGTNTDAVVLSNGDILGWSKQRTTEDVTTGVIGALSSALDCASNSQDQGQSIRFSHSIRVERVHIGTTHFLNAVLQKEHLVPVAVIRLCGPASQALPPFSDFPESLEKIISGPIFMVDGGYYFDGENNILPLRKKQIENCIQEIKDTGIHHIVVSGIFSSVNNTQEKLVGKWIKEFYPRASITLSHEVAQLGILLRENSAILNESLKPLSQKTTEALTKALNHLKVHCQIFLTQNDGTLLSIEEAQKFPVLTFASGPTNSMRGAAFLSDLKDAVVIDIGGTSTDVGILSSGFPRQASSKVEVGGVQTSFQMPDTLSIALGGGSLVKFTEALESKVLVGPKSVGNNLRRESLIFGGKTLTATDIAVAKGHCDLGKWENRSHWLPDILATAADDKIHSMIEDVIDRVKTSAEGLPVILVGGGSVLLNSNRYILGTTQVIRPEHYQVANAVGAALSRVSAQIDTIENITTFSRDRAIKKAKEEATALVLKKGANPETIEIVDVIEVPLTFLPGNVTRLRVKAVGDNRFNQHTTNGVLWKGGQPISIPKATPILMKDKSQVKVEINSQTTSQIESDTEIIAATIDEDSQEWLLTCEDIECLAIGAGILGCGGGGNPLYGKLWAQRMLKDGKKIRVISAKSFCCTAKEGDVAIPCGYMGAPTVGGEMLYCMPQAKSAVQAIIDLYSNTEYKEGNLEINGAGQVEKEDGITYIANFNATTDISSKDSKKVKALFCAEVGGANCMTPLIIAAELGLPVLDCDLMGRAFPEIQMCTHFIKGNAAYPSALGDFYGSKYVCLHAESPKIMEDHFRKVCVDMGCRASTAGAPMSAADIQAKTVLNSISRAFRLGKAVLHARRCKTSPITAILQFEQGIVICTGKVCDIKRKTEGGFAKGEMKIHGSGGFISQHYLINFQNENLIAKRLNENDHHEVIACVPDLISVVDLETGEPIPTDEVSYGLRVAVLALPAPPLLRTPRALEVVGPQAFGYTDVFYKPVGEYLEHMGITPDP